MNLYISFLEDAHVRFPPQHLCDPLISRMSSVLADLIFTDFDDLGIYMYLPGPHNTFEMDPGVTLRLNRREKSIEVKCVLDGAAYMNLGGSNWSSKLNAIVDGTIASLHAVLKRYKRLDEFELHEILLEAVKLPVS